MTSGGAENYNMTQVRKLDGNLIRFDFLTTREGEHAYNDEIRRLGGGIFVIPPPKESGAMKYMRNAQRIMREHGPYAAVHAHTFLNCGLNMLAAKMCGVKIRISHSHSAKDYQYAGLKQKLYNRSMRFMIKAFSTKYAACGVDAGINLFGKRFLDTKKGVLLHNAIDIDRFTGVTDSEKLSIREEFSAGPEVLLLVNIGRFAIQKNHEFSIKIAEQLKGTGINFKMLLLGQGELTEKIKAMASERGLADRVVFAGVRHDVPAVLAAADVFILPSFFEGLPVAAIEAQATGLPCICSEHVTRETDIGLSLVKFLPIGQGCEEAWARQCAEFAGYTRPTREAVRVALFGNGYKAETGVKTLTDIYTGRI